MKKAKQKSLAPYLAAVLRKRRGSMSQGALSEACGVSRVTILRAEREHYNSRVISLDKIAKGLGCPLHLIIKEAEKLRDADK